VPRILSSPSSAWSKKKQGQKRGKEKENESVGNILKREKLKPRAVGDGKETSGYISPKVNACTRKSNRDNICIFIFEVRTLHALRGMTRPRSPQYRRLSRRKRNNEKRPVDGGKRGGALLSIALCPEEISE
jgi:hypothetical protein